MEVFLGAFTAEWEQRKAAFLHDLTLGRRTLSEEDERRRGGSVRSAVSTETPKSGFRVRTGRQGRPCSLQRRADRPMRARFAGLAAGSQPAIVKMASFGGGSRLGAMINYVARNGAVVIENERGDQLRGRDQLSTIGDEWDHLMKNRAESRDIGLFRISVAGGGPADDERFNRARKIVTHGLGDRAFVFSVTHRADGSGFEIDGVTVLRNSGGERLTADDAAAAIVQTRMEPAETGTKFQFTGYGNGTDYGTSQVRSLVTAHKGQVQDEQERVIADAKQAGDLVQLEWRDQLHSRKPRDVMHLVLSARAGTDTHAFHNAARDFLGQQFAGHRYVFSLHDAQSDPKAEAAGGKRPHVHVHAIIAMQSDAGDRVETTIAAFRQWRLGMAEKARAHGINMEMTDRRDRASAPSYSRNQVRPVNTIGRTQHEGTSAAAEQRYGAKRDDLPSYSATTRSQSYMQRAYGEWRKVRHLQELGAQQYFIRSQMVRLEVPRTTVGSRDTAHHEAGNSGSPFRTYLVRLTELVSEGDDMRHMTRPEFEAYEKRVEIALFRAEKTLPPEARKDFEEIAQAAREHVNVRREIVELLEVRGTAGMSDPRSRESGADGPQEDKQRWNDAVDSHGFEAANVANKALLEIERTREAIERIAVERPDEVSALKKELDIHITKAAELGASGNGIIREVAEIDDDLKAALQSIERDRQKRENEKSSARTQSDEAATANRTTPQVDKQTHPDDRDARSPESARDTAPRQETGDMTKSDPAKQYVPRLEEIQRETKHRNVDRER
ncbi:conjugal transfer protein TraA [Phyllobacterium endophyticum]|uniref:conjugal transfer protein TraA n=1 Tax=Phyllobacterium endophyticum TaxID=1149773 RepID=UPI0011C8C1F8|nr:conjugal transfer protein TraA [Phyllobacterium endophyticum]TXR49505.1 conjugal transfer protein TraA [Phyllobacterium endophyticum]